MVGSKRGGYLVLEDLGDGQNLAGMSDLRDRT